MRIGDWVQTSKEYNEMFPERVFSGRVIEEPGSNGVITVQVNGCQLSKKHIAKGHMVGAPCQGVSFWQRMCHSCCSDSNAGEDWGNGFFNTLKKSDIDQEIAADEISLLNKLRKKYPNK